MITGLFRFRICKHFFILFLFILLSFFYCSNVKGETTICDATDDQYYPQIISDGAGGSITVWEDRRSGDAVIYAQRMNSDGEAQWAANGVPVSNRYGQYAPKIVSDGSGGAFIAWSGYGGGINQYNDIFVQYINSSGSLQWGEDGINICDQIYDQRDVQLISDGSGGIIVTWADLRSGYDVYAQRLNSAGTPQWTTDGVLVCGAANQQENPVIISDGSGGAIIAWADNRGTPADSKGVYVQRINSSGVNQWTANGVPLYAGSRMGGDPAIIADGSGGAIVTWYDDRTYSTGGSYDIYAQRINSSGAVQWTANGVPVCSASDGQEYPQLVSDGSGGAFITWYDGRSSGVNIYAQRINSSGVAQWTADGVALTSGSDKRFGNRIIRYSAEDTVIIWYDTGYNYNKGEIYAQRLNGSGEIQWEEGGVLVSGESGEGEYPELIGDGSGGAFIVWHDYRSNEDYDIYYQHVYSSGTLTLPEVSFTATSQKVDEGVSSTEITVGLSSISDADVTVPFTIGGTATYGESEDFTTTTSPVVISAGSDSEAVTVYVEDDSDFEQDETVIITLGTPTNADLGATTVHTITIQDNEPSADIAVSKSVSSGRVDTGEQVIFTVLVSNNGPEDSTDITISDSLPAGLTYVSHEASSGTYNHETGQWTLDALADEGTVSLTITAAVTEKGRFTNTATKTESTPIDPVTGNDADSATVSAGMIDMSWLLLLLDE